MSFSSPAVNAALHQLLVPEPNDPLLEHRVASFAITLLTDVFQKNTRDHHWVFTPEQRESASNRISDYSVEAVSPDDPLTIFPWLNMEFKRRGGGHRTYKALYQLVQTVKFSLNQQNPARYLVVVSGNYISFWEIDFDTSMGRNPEITNLWGCRSLIKPSIYPGDEDAPLIRDITDDYPDDIQHIYNDDLGGPSPKDDQWRDALDYHEDALFNLQTQKHWVWIERMMEHVARRRPATFVDPEMMVDD